VVRSYFVKNRAEEQNENCVFRSPKRGAGNGVFFVSKLLSPSQADRRATLEPLA